MGEGTRRVCSFTLTEDNIDSGLICGGTLQVLVEPLDRPRQALLREIAAYRATGKTGALVTALDPQDTTKVFFHDDGSVTGELAADAADAIGTAVPGVIRGDTTQEMLQNSAGDWFVEQIPGYPKLIIFGGGHCSFFIARFAKTVN